MVFRAKARDRVGVECERKRANDCDQIENRRVVGARAGGADGGDGRAVGRARRPR